MADHDGEATIAAPDNDTNVPGASVADQNMILFGSLNDQVADEFCDQIESALAEGVASLPLMGTAIGDGGESRDERMIKKLRKAYYRNIDLFELYAGRNIFSVAARTPRFRQRVVDAFMRPKTTAQDDTTATNDGSQTLLGIATSTASSNTAQMGPSDKIVAYPTKDDVPSEESVQAIKQELKDLRLKLKKARTARNDRVKASKELKDMQKVTTEAKNVLVNQPIDKLQGSVDAAVQGRAELDTLQKQGKEASQKMDEGKRERDENEQQNENVLQLEQPKKKKMLTLEECYEEDRKILHEAPPDGLVKLKGLLQRKI